MIYFVLASLRIYTNLQRRVSVKIYVQRFEYVLNMCSICTNNITLIYLNALTTHKKRQKARASLFKRLASKTARETYSACYGCSNILQSSLIRNMNVLLKRMNLFKH